MDLLALLERYGIKSSEALNIGQYKNLKTAIKNKNANLKLNDAGIPCFKYIVSAKSDSEMVYRGIATMVEDY